MAYIIDTYNKYDQWDREHSVYHFTINGVEYAVKSVILFWGEPQLPIRLDENKNPKTYFIYNTKEEAMEFIRQVKSYNR